MAFCQNAANSAGARNSIPTDDTATRPLTTAPTTVQWRRMQPYGAVLPLCHENHARWRLMSRAPWNNVLHPAVETAGLLLATAPTAVRGRRMHNLRILCIIHLEPPVCLGCYIRYDAPQAYREVLLFSIGVIYGLQECSNSQKARAGHGAVFSCVTLRVVGSMTITSRPSLRA